MKRNTQDRGITLVALVVTIIILLILAGVTIAQLTGNGLFENAKLAKEKQENTQELENTILADYETKIDEYVDGTRDNINLLTIDGNEHEAGTFYGKKLYYKSFTGTTPSSNAGTLIDISNLNIDEFVDIKGNIKDTKDGYFGYGYQIPINFSFPDSSSNMLYYYVWYNSDTKSLIYRSYDGYLNLPYYITIYYTKV